MTTPQRPAQPTARTSAPEETQGLVLITALILVLGVVTMLFA